ncbi:hypothetical protein Tco_0739419, partial [Tanacetum coccineum]
MVSMASQAALAVLGFALINLFRRVEERFTKLSSLEDTTVPESFPPLSTPVTTAGNAP